MIAGEKGYEGGPPPAGWVWGFYRLVKAAASLAGRKEPIFPCVNIDRKSVV